MPRSFKLYLIPVILLLAVTVPHLDQGDFRRDTAPYAAIGHRMWTDGPLFTPYMTPDTPYFNKPPMAFLIHGFFLKVFGLHLIVARIPSILAAAGVVVLSMMTVRLTASRAEAVASGVVLALTYEFFRRTREISLDFWLLFFMMAAVYLAARSLKYKQRLPLILSGVPLGLALLCKPFLALMAIPIFALWFATSNRRSLIPSLFVGTLPLAILVALPWHLHMYHVFGDQFLKQAFGHEVMDRARGQMTSKPFYYYFAEWSLTYWPWLPLLCWAIYRRCKKYKPGRPLHRDLIFLGGTWAAIYVGALSCFPDKKPNYGLPVFPMMSWIVAWAICRLRWPKLRTFYARGCPRVIPIVVSIAVLIAILPIKFQKPPDPDWQKVFAWMQENKISKTQLANFGLWDPEVCYYYVKTGIWLPRLQKIKDQDLQDWNIVVPLETAPSNTRSLAIFSTERLAIVPGNAAAKLLQN